MQILQNWYNKQVKSNIIQFNADQLKLCITFDHFLKYFNLNVLIRRLFYKNHSMGFYVYGLVGCGKTMLMNQLFLSFQTQKKLRIHFHEFMFKIHHELSTIKTDNPLEIIAKNLKKQYEIIFLDEMFVDDIATAMILKNLFNAIFNEKIIILTTSNQDVKDLYSNGLMRDRFLPAIKLLQEKLSIFHLNTNTDYRLIQKNKYTKFFFTSKKNTSQLIPIFKKLALSNQLYQQNIIIHNRKIHFIAKADNIIYFDFLELCGNNRSQIDYLELVKHFQYFMITNIFILHHNHNDIAKRFMSLIDILYDAHKQLIISATCSIDEIFNKLTNKNDYKRCISRLHQMLD